MFDRRLFIILTTLAVSMPAIAGDAGWSTQPTIHGDHVVFVSEGDIFSAQVHGGADPITAHRLTTHAGSESRPHLSPDGRWIAFTGEYGGSPDVHVMPAEGGSPVQLTFHPGDDLVVGWSPDGTRVLFASRRSHPLGSRELWMVPVNGGMPEPAGFGECAAASSSVDGKRLAFNRWSNDGWNWKNYRGGTAPEIWIGSPADDEYRNVTNHESNDLFPMWMGGRVYFLSDRTSTPNIWSIDPAGGEAFQVSSFDGTGATAEAFDVRWASADAGRNGRIVIEQGGELAIVDTGRSMIIRPTIQLASDRASTRSRHVDPVEQVDSMALSMEGDRLVFTARGDAFMVDLDQFKVRRVTTGSDVRDRDASFYDDEWILLVTEHDGEQEIAMASSESPATLEILTEPMRTWYFTPMASPDGRWIVFGERRGGLYGIDLDKGDARRIAQCEHGEITDYRISPDGAWVAWTMPDSNSVRQVYLARIDGSGSTHRIGDGMHHDHEPRWDPDGRYLWFLSDRGLNPRLGNVEFRHTYTQTTRIYAVSLAADMPPPDMAAMASVGFDHEMWSMPPYPADEDMEFDEESMDEEAGEEPREEDEQAELMKIDLAGLSQRIHPLPVPSGDYAGLEAGWGGFFVLSMPPMGLFEEDAAWETGEAFPSSLLQWDVASGEAMPLSEYVDEYVINADCTVIVTNGMDGLSMIDLEMGESMPLPLEPFMIEVDTKAEWAQILDEAWRLQRDFFWNPTYNGIDWNAMRDKYASRLDHVGSREELDALIGRMLSELQTSHAYVMGGGDGSMGGDYVPFAMLGADLAVDDEGFRIERIVPGRSWDKQTTSPLAQPWLGVREGDVIIAVDGREVEPGSNPWSMLDGVAGDTVELAILPGDGRESVPGDPDSAGMPFVVDIPVLFDESALRYQAWVDDNRRAVDVASSGRLGYMHLLDMSAAGLSQFGHQFYGQLDKDGLVIDVRDNGGGFVSQLILAQLAQEITGWDVPRHGTPSPYPAHAFPGHMVVLINQNSGSDGDIFPYMFREMGLGPLIGTRTWGGVVGIRADKDSVDGGLTSQPEYATWTQRDGWDIENYGVDPDIEVDITPADRAAGRDPQLDRAVLELRRMLAEDPIERQAAPIYPGSP